MAEEGEANVKKESNDLRNTPMRPTGSNSESALMAGMANGVVSTVGKSGTRTTNGETKPKGKRSYERGSTRTDVGIASRLGDSRRLSLPNFGATRFGTFAASEKPSSISANCRAFDS